MGTKQNKTPTGNGGIKRSRPVDSTDSDSDSDLIDNVNWPRFLVIEGTDENHPLSKLSPFAISKGLQGLAGTPKDVKRLRNGQVLVEVDKKCYSDNLLRSSKLAECPISVSPHRALNSSKGIMRCPDLKDCSEEEILENLKSQQVGHVKRMIVTRDGEKRPTNTFVVTFNLPKIPSSIKVGFLNVPLEVFVPNPLRCFKCQRFGHHRENCRRDAVCAKCGQKDHEEAQCDQALQCINCQGHHAAYSKDCPKWKEEKEVQRLKHSLGISFAEARKRAQPPIQTYASVTKQPQQVKTNSISVQTELTWLNSSAQPKRIQPVPPPSVDKKNTSSQTAGTSSASAKDNPKQQSQKINRSRSVSRNSSRREASRSSDPVPTHSRFECLGTEGDQEEVMDTNPVPNQKPCPLSKKKENSKGTWRNPPNPT